MSGTAKTTHQVPLRSALGRVRGLGSAKSGVHHWWVQRMTAVALVPLCLWFVFAVFALAGEPLAVVQTWIGRPINTVLLLCLIGAMFHHLQLGMQVVIEDYIHEDGARLIGLLAMRAGVALLALTAAVSVLKIAL
jgi:succinate dehydrogenase / fumarate reductase membrane anchor subunit